MAKRPGHVEVITEVGFCNFCNRTRNLRREEHHLGGLVRTIVSCETCHRTLSSTMGVETAEPVQAPEPEMVEVPEVAKAVEAKPKPKRAAAKKPVAKKTAAAKPKTPPKPRSTATRKKTTTK